MIATYLTIGFPSLMILVGILMNRDAIGALRTDISRLDGRMTKLEDNMNSLRGEMGALRMSFHNDVVMLLERDTSWHRGWPSWSGLPSPPAKAFA